VGHIAHTGNMRNAYSAFKQTARELHTWLCCASELDTYSAGNSPSVFWLEDGGLKIGT